MKPLLTISAFSLLIVVGFNCSKLNNLKNPSEKLGTESINPLVSTGYCYYCGIIDSMPANYWGTDSNERMSILGMQHVNPYLLPNIQQAYNNLGVAITATVTNYYVRFLPNSGQQAGFLDSLLDTQGLELFEEPMDYDILMEGDYYQDPSIPLEQPTYLYSVVPNTFQFPAGISYSILAQIHIPSDNYTAVETEAERLAAIQDSLNATGGAAATVKPDVPQCNPNCHWDFTQGKCVCCPNGYTWNGSQCIPNCPPGQYWNGTACVPLPPPPPASDASIPAGNITVTDVNLNTTPGVRNVRIVAKRWFKIEKLYTDNNGHFVATKHFKHKVKIRVKFRNNFADIKGARGARFWQMFFPIQQTIGVYKSNKNNIAYNFVQSPNSSGGFAKNINNRLWGAATINNAIQEHRDYASQFGFSAAPTGLRVLINGNQGNALAGSTPLFGIRTDFQTVSDAFASVFVYGGNTNQPGGWTQAILALSGVHLDVTLNYATPMGLKFSDDQVKALVYHEMSHASHYSQVGKTWYGNFVNSELDETAKFPSGSNSPYGTGGSTNSPTIALGEGWAYHMGFYLANQKYNVENAGKGDPIVYVQNTSLNSGTDLVSLENYRPNLSGGSFNWIPKGLMLDLIDTGEPSLTTVNDQVSGYTISQIFAALQSDVSSLSAYKARLLQQNPSNPTNNQMNSLFASYGY